MKSIISLFLFAFLLVSSPSGAQGVTKQNRQPYAAGHFYPLLVSELNSMLKEYFAKAVPPKNDGTVVALIVPHADYMFSGLVAASGYNQLDRTKKYKTIFILGTCHTMLVNGAAVYARGDYMTPLGTVHVDTDLANKLIREHPEFQDLPRAHDQEHSIEVQLPFLQYLYGNELSIVPMVVGTNDPQVIKKMAAALKPYLVPDNLFVISSDFSHYPPKDLATKVDKTTADAIVKNSPARFFSVVQENESKNMAGLATCMCGWNAALTLLYMTENIPGIRYQEIQYLNSGDTKYGDADNTVGYWSITATMNSQNPSSATGLSENDKKELLSLARKTLEQYLVKHSIPVVDASNFPPSMTRPSGAFVTLLEKGQLRGCIGRFDATEPLYKVVQQMAVASATQDYRFSPVDRDELDDLEIEISVLSPMKRIYSKDEIILGKHGIYIKKGMAAGTFLPQVATENNMTVDEFLGRCARDKAGIGYDGWKTAELYTYEAEVFKEQGHGK
jgi:AmmeMemoRadiSam system protein B/AmmeMemoRadiSam system protein A